MAERNVRTPQRPRVYAVLLISSVLVVAGSSGWVARAAGSRELSRGDASLGVVLVSKDSLV